MAESTKKKTSTKKTSTTASKPELTDADLVAALAKVQRRKLSPDDFKAVTAVIALLS